MNSYIPKPFHASQMIIGIAEVMDIAIKTIEKTRERKEEISSDKGMKNTGNQSLILNRNAEVK
ncbi:MAG: hypothetical protein WCJ95_21125 [Mariniphaga sp.]